MKKLVFVFSLMITMLIASVSSAASVYYNNDTNYPGVWMHMGKLWFVNKASVHTISNEPDYCSLSIEAFYVNYKNGNKTSVPQSFSFMYNKKKIRMITEWPKGSGNERWLKPKIGVDDTGPAMHIGEAAYYIRYGKKFYGAYKWGFDNVKNREYYTIFKQSFYDALNGKK